MSNLHQSNLGIQKASPADLHAFAELFSNYPYKSFQQKAQRLDAAKLAAFFAEGMRSTLADAETACWVVRDGDEVLGAAALQPNAWHGRFYGLNMGRCNTFLSYRRPAEVTPLLIDAMFEEAERRGYEHLSVRVDGSEYENLHLLESRGFRLIDCNVKLGAPIRVSPASDQGVLVRAYEAADRDAVLRIAGDAHVAFHFFNDETLNREASRAILRAWVERCLDGLAKYVYVAEDPQAGVVGFVTYMINRRLNEALGVRVLVLDYIVLDSACQGRGLGPTLLESSLSMLANDYDQVELRTSENNYPALSLYTRYGFRILSSDFILHWRKAN